METTPKQAPQKLDFQGPDPMFARRMRWSKSHLSSAREHPGMRISAERLRARQGVALRFW